MDCSPAYSVEDEIYFMHLNKIRKAKIVRIIMDITFESCDIKYYLDVKDRKTPIILCNEEISSTINKLIVSIESEYFDEFNND